MRHCTQAMNVALKNDEVLSMKNKFKRYALGGAVAVLMASMSMPAWATYTVYRTNTVRYVHRNAYDAGYDAGYQDRSVRAQNNAAAAGLAVGALGAVALVGAASGGGFYRPWRPFWHPFRPFGGPAWGPRYRHRFHPWRHRRWR
jgi:hypothetical protein